ncbi:hypothetical protein [Domibacillus indicus]|uniref:hypothetical protein n=1 Tax=Domibacillus indicus TaxID=1437523 RepID=UPI00061815C0|nr:hypothetical protein [Domibacillus indicus]
MNIGLSLLLTPFAFVFLDFALYLRKRKKSSSRFFLTAGALLSVLAVLLWTGVLDPYSSYIR